MATHYVAQLKIERVEKADVRQGQTEPKREINEVAQITLKATELSALVSKLIAHVQIIDES